MLETFLEISVETEDVGESYDELRSLGFSDVSVGDIRRGAYAVASDGKVNIALQTRRLDGPSLSFVRPNLADYVRALRRKGIDLEFASLGDQEFHELGFRDPNGQLVTLLEARTFPPPPSDELALSVCGKFLEYSLATASLEQSRHFWEALGLLVVAEGIEPQPWMRLEGAGLTLGLHQAALFRPGPTFVASQLAARLDYLRAKGLRVASSAPMFSPQRLSATLGLHASLPIYLVEDPLEAD